MSLISNPGREAAPQPLSFTPREKAVVDCGFPAECWDSLHDACRLTHKFAKKFFGDKNDNSSPCLERWIFLFGKNVELPNQTILLELPNKGSIKVDSPTNTLFWIHPNTRGNHFNQRIRNPTQEIGVATSPPLKVAYRVIGHIPDPGVPGRDIVIIEETISGDIGRAVLQGPIWGKSQDTATAQKSLALEYEWTGLQR